MGKSPKYSLDFGTINLSFWHGGGVQPLTERMEARRQAAGPKIAPSAERIEGRLAAGPINLY